jgi:hypothetical protein
MQTTFLQSKCEGLFINFLITCGGNAGREEEITWKKRKEQPGVGSMTA